MPEYETKFVDLAQYAPHMISTPREKAQKFQEDLAPWIKSRLASLMIQDYGDASRKTMIVEDNSLRAT